MLRALALAVTALALLAAPAAAKPKPQAGAHVPVVLFPAFHFTKLQVVVDGQRTDPACPASGTFEDWFLNEHPSTTFSQVCQDELLTLRDSVRGHKLHFDEQPGV